MRKTFLWIGIILLSPILLFIIITVLLYIPPVQNFAVRKVASYASEKTKLDIRVEHVELIFPLNLGVDGVRVIQQNDSLPQVKDTVADIKNIKVDVQLMPLFHSDVEINKLEFKQAKINTTNFIHQARVKGSIDYLSVNSHGIRLDKQTVRLNNADLRNANINVELSDTVPKDTTKSNNKWKIIVDKVKISNSDFTVHMPGDTMQVEAYMGETALENGAFDLGKGDYYVGKLDWNAGKLKYDNNFETHIKGLDYNHIDLSKINIGIDSMHYCTPDMAMSLRTCSFEEKSGIKIKELKGKIALDSVSIHLPIMELRTPDSNILAELIMDWNTFDKKNPGKMYIRMMASIGKQDIMRFCGGMPSKFVQRYPNRPLSIRCSLTGNMKVMDFTGVDVNLPTAFHVKSHGGVVNPTDMKRIKGYVNMQAEMYDLGFVTCMLDPAIMNKYRIPRGIRVDGDFRVNRKKYSADFIAREGKGIVKAKGNFDAGAMKYQASMKINNLQLHDFMPHDSLYAFSGDVDVKGLGTNFMSKSSWLTAKADVKKFQYGHWNLDDIKASALLKNGIAHADIDSHNPIMDGLVRFDALLNTKNIGATVVADVRKADIYRMRLMDKPFVTGMCASVDFGTDLKNYYKLEGSVSDLTLIDSKKTYRPADIVMNVLTNKDTTYAQVYSGNLELDMASKGGYERLMKEGMSFYKELMRQISEKKINQSSLRNMLPTMRLYLMSGNDNPFCNFLSSQGYQFSDLFIDMTSSPLKGLNGKCHLYSLNADSMQIDTINIFVTQNDTSRVNFGGQVKNRKDNPQFVFDARFDGYIFEKGAGVNVRYYDAENKLGLALGAEASMEEKGIRFHLMPDRPIVGYREFSLNKDNYIFLGDDKRIDAKVDLIADDGTGLKLFTTPNEEALQDLTLSVNKLNLEQVTSVLPYMPRMSGMANGDFHVLQTKEQLSVTSDISVDKMTYEHCPLGNIGTEFVYLPNADGSHSVDGRLTRNDEEVMTIKGTYKQTGGGVLDAQLGLDRFPLSMVNGFIPQQLMGLEGYGEGKVDIKGSLHAPQVNGEVYLDSAYLFSIPYGVNLRFDNDPVRIVGSNLLFENFEMYAHNNNPLNIYGNLDFSNLDNMKMNIKMRAMNYQLIDAKMTSRSLTYGKAFVDFYGTIKGDMDNLKMRGTLDVLGNTDMSYVLKNSPLTTDDQLKELVTFTNFGDTAVVNVKKPPLTGLDMDLSMNIEQGAQVKCDLNAERSNYVNLEGGGSLRMLYNSVDNLRLIGRYTLNNGEMKYALPVIPLKTFTIQNGSYIEFLGDPMNPKLNIIATERMNALVSAETGNSRNVAFDVGVKVSKTLQNMGLEFTLEAPEDMTIQNELATMGTAQRGKLAVTMLTTGMYLADGNTSAFSMNSALNSFLQNEISNIAGSALKTMDLSVGMDNSTSSDGKSHTDYSFKFAKRFWNNKLSIIIGGKVSSGSSQQTQENQSFIDNVSFEYRLDQTAMRYVRLFYDKNSDDLLEGRIIEYGGGVVLRRKMNKFGELFDFRKNKDIVPPLLPDSTKQQ